MLHGPDLGYDRGVKPLLYVTVDDGTRTKNPMSAVDSAVSKGTTFVPVTGTHVKAEFTSVDGRSAVWEGDITDDRDNLPLIQTIMWRNGANEVFNGLAFGATAGTAEIDGTQVATSSWQDSAMPSRWVPSGSVVSYTSTFLNPPVSPRRGCGTGSCGAAGRRL